MGARHRQPSSEQLLASDVFSRLLGAAEGAGAEQPAGLLQYLQVAYRRKRILIGAAVAGALAGFLFSAAQTPAYRAETSLEIEDLNPNYLRFAELSPEPRSYEALPDIKTQSELLQSDALVRRVVKRLNWVESPGPVQTSSWRRIFGGKPEPPSFDSIVRDAEKRLEVHTPSQTRVVRVSFESPDPKRAAEFLNVLTDEFVEANAESRWNTSKRVSGWLEQKVEEMRLKLQRSEASLQGYASQTGLLYNADRNTVSEEKLRQIQTEVTRAQSERLAKQSRYEMARAASLDSLTEIANDPTLREYQLRLTDLHRQRAELQAIYTPENSKVTRVEAQIQTLSAAIQKERASILARIRNDYEAAARQEALLGSEFLRQTEIVNRDAGSSVQYNVLRGEVESNRQLYDAMLKRVKEAGIASALKSSNVRIVDPAVPPPFPYKPRTAINIAAGMMSALFLTLVLVFVRDQAEASLNQPGDAGGCLNARELGVIFSAAPTRRALPFGNKLKLLGNGKPEPMAKDRVELITLNRKSSPTAASFRGVLASLLFADPETRPRTLVLTSAGPGEGKTTVTSNLAIALVEVQKRVLIIDGDLHRPRLHEVFNVPNEKGLSNLLTTPEIDDETLQESVHGTGLPGLSLLPAGPPNSNGTTLLYSRVLPEIFDRLEKEYDTILIDTPPALLVPDARLIGRIANSVILISRSGMTTKFALQMLWQRFEGDGTPVMGVILNDWNPRLSPRTFYGYPKKYTC